MCLCAYRSIDFGVLAMFLLQLLHSLLLLLPLLLVQALQVLPPLVLLQHLVAFELLVSLGVVVLQVLGGLDREPDRGCHLEILLIKMLTCSCCTLESDQRNYDSA